jgi:hypothetical protein
MVGDEPLLQPVRGRRAVELLAPQHRAGGVSHADVREHLGAARVALPPVEVELEPGLRAHHRPHRQPEQPAGAGTATSGTPPSPGARTPWPPPPCAAAPACPGSHACRGSSS